MTAPTSTGTAPDRPSRARNPGRWLLLGSFGLGILGLGMLAASLLLLPPGEPLDSDGEASTPASESAPSASAGHPDSGENPAPIEPLDRPDQTATDAGTAAGHLREEVDPAWVKRVAAQTRVPPRALTAYSGAAHRAQQEQPTCGLGWNTLAAIGYVESEHGRINGGSVTASGRVSPEIFGVALDGGTTERIPDTDGGSIDGDATWDRAVGPMQFIPETWERWGSDGNADGVADPQQIDDAAYTAARYLCADGRDLTDPAQWIIAVSAYNDTLDYNHRVADAANEYARLAE